MAYREGIKYRKKDVGRVGHHYAQFKIKGGKVIETKIKKQKDK